MKVDTLFLSVFNPAAEQASKRHRGNEEPTTEEQMETETGLFGKNAPPPGFKKPQQGAAAAAAPYKERDDKPELRNDNSSVFISNLAYTLKEPEAKLRTMFEPCGPIEQIRPVFSTKGAFKGYCYIQFESVASVSEALKLDRQEMENRPVFVSPCVDKNKNPDFKVHKRAHPPSSFTLGPPRKRSFFRCARRCLSTTRPWRNRRSSSPGCLSPAQKSSWRTSAKATAASKKSAWSRIARGSPR